MTRQIEQDNVDVAGTDLTSVTITASNVVYPYIIMATTAGLVILLATTILYFGGYYGLTEKVDLQDINRRMIVDVLMITYLSWALCHWVFEVSKFVMTTSWEILRERTSAVVGSILFTVWIKNHFLTIELSKLISHHFILGVLLGLFLMFFLKKSGRESRDDTQKNEKQPYKIQQIEHIIKDKVLREEGANASMCKVLGLLVKRIETLERREDESHQVMQATVTDVRLDEGDSDSEISEVYLSDTAGKRGVRRKKLGRREVERSEKSRKTYSSVLGKDLQPERRMRRRSKSMDLPVRRDPEPPSKEPKQRLRSERCPHCADKVTKEHHCWVLEKKLKCFQCGRRNHIAIACKNKGFGMQLEVLARMNKEELEKEVLRLNRLLLMRSRKEREWDDRPPRRSVVRRNTQSDVARHGDDSSSSDTDMDTVMGSQDFLSQEPQRS